MMKNKPGPEEQRMILMRSIAQVTTSAIVQATDDSNKFFSLLEQTVEKIISEKIDEEMKAICKADYKAVIHQVKYDLCKLPEERTINVIREEKDNVTSVDFGKKR